MSCHITSSFWNLNSIHSSDKAMSKSCRTFGRVKSWLKQIAGQMTIIPKPDVAIICLTLGYEKSTRLKMGCGGKKWWSFSETFMVTLVKWHKKNRIQFLAKWCRIILSPEQMGWFLDLSITWSTRKTTYPLQYTIWLRNPYSWLLVMPIKPESKILHFH